MGDSPITAMAVEGIASALSPATAASQVMAMGAEGRKFVRISPMKFILRLPKPSNSKQQPNSVPAVAGSPITAPTESIPAPTPTPITAQVPVAVPPKSSKPDNLDEKKAGEKLRMRYQEEAARKKSRKIQILAKADVPLPPQPPSSSKQSISNKRKSSSCSSFSAANGSKKQKSSSLIMNKARKEYISCLEVRNLAAMAAQKRMQLKTVTF